MSLVSIVLLGFAMSADAFAAALGKGAGMKKPHLGEALRIGLTFGVVEALTPVLGWLIGSAASGLIAQIDHWIAFVLLVGLGLHMIRQGAKGDDSDAPETSSSNGLLATALAGLATSIDAMAVGVGLAFADVHIAVVAVVIGLCTFTMVTIGILAGQRLNALVGRRAEVLGGLILIGVGTIILFEHLREVPVA